MHNKMLKVAISINKGGQGKTTLTKTLATAAADAGFNVMILDLDTQQNAVAWRKRRTELQKGKSLPLVEFVGEQNLPDQLRRAEAAGCEIVFIDTPPGRSSEAMAAVEEADLVLIPFWNDQDSYEGVAKTTLLARRLETDAIGILNFATPNSKSHEETAREVLKVIKLPMAPVILHRYDAHRMANVRGLTAQEYDPKSSSALEIKTLWKWLSAHLQLSKSANVHKGAA